MNRYGRNKTLRRFIDKFLNHFDLLDITLSITEMNDDGIMIIITNSVNDRELTVVFSLDGENSYYCRVSKKESIRDTGILHSEDISLLAKFIKE
jgi:hypothetical protein